MKLKTYLIVVLLAVTTYNSRAQKKAPNMLGLILPLSKDSLAHAAGFTMIGESVSKMLSPSLTETQFQNNIEQLKKAQSKVYMCNILFPGTMKIAGPVVNTPRVLAYVDSVFLRASQANIKYIILGSSGSRRLPDGYDNKKAQADFTVLCGKLALVAQKHNIMLVLESLETAETNFLLNLKETAEVVRAVNNPNFKLNADIYHMGRMKETPQVIVDNADIIVHCEIAELEIRTLPGMKGRRFKTLFTRLKKSKL
jgi:hypothetical protein